MLPSALAMLVLTALYVAATALPALDPAVNGLTAAVVGTVLSHPHTYAPKIPAGATRIVYISHVQGEQDLAQAEAIGRHIERGAIDHILAGDTPSGAFYEIQRLNRSRHAE